MDLNMLSKSFALVILMMIGYVFKRKGDFTQQTIDTINGLVFRLVLPAFLFIAFLEVDFESKFLMLPLVGFALALAMLLIGHLLAYIFKMKDIYYKFALTTFEGGMIAYPIFSMIFGASNIFMIALIDLGNALLFFTVIMVMLAKHSDKSISSALKDSIPILFAMFAGMIVNALKLNIYLSGTLFYDTLIQTFTMLSIPMVTLIALSIGIDMQFDFKSFLSPLRLVITRYFFAVIFSLALYFMVLMRFGFPIIYLHALMILALSPSSLLLPALVPKDERKMMSSMTSMFVPVSILVLIGYAMVFI
ncbi:MAG: hypothetical protein NDI94_00650 [Candidatus Woesearchaeota archaeon]|nr:hypothetical protein [Candidatus Woesearchaeota archaeon]